MCITLQVLISIPTMVFKYMVKRKEIFARKVLKVSLPV